MRSVATIGRWSTRRPWRAIAAWLAFVALAVVLGIAAGTKQLENGAVGESARGYSLMDAHRRLAAGARVRLPAQRRRCTAERPAVPRATVADVSAAHADRRSAATGRDRASRRTGTRCSSSGIVQAVRCRSTRFARSVLAAGAAHPEVTIEETGDISASDARDRVVNRDLHRAELLSIPVTLLVLLFAFGAIVAALVPVLLALTAVAAAFGLLGPISQAFPLDDSVKTVVLLIGMAVGVDYALFYVIRSREERHRGLPSHEALERTARTSGRTVLVSGTTVAIAMAGMFVIGARRLQRPRERRRSPSSRARSPAPSPCCRRCSSCSGRGSTAAGSRSCRT